MHFAVRVTGTPSRSTTASIVARPGVATSSNGSGLLVDVALGAAVAASRFAAYPQDGQATYRSSPTSAGAIHSWFTSPPMSPGSASTATNRRPHRSKIRRYASTIASYDEFQAIHVAVERVGVLHQELPTADDPASRPGLVPVLPLDLVQVHREVAVRGVLTVDERRDDLLVRRPQPELAPGPVLQLEHVVAVGLPPARALPRLGRQQRQIRTPRAPARSISSRTIASTFRSTRSPSGRNVHARGDPPDEAPAHEQGVGGRLRVGGVVPERPHEQP